MTFIINSSGTPLRDFADCRVNGCTAGECIRQGSQYVCKQGKLMFVCLTL